jgi:uncharacterized protein YndB with AHSA1/START domain
VDGQLEQIGGRWRLRFVRRLPHPPEKVWRALTEPAHLEVWFPAEIRGERTTGAALSFVFRAGEGPTRDGQMLTYDPPSVLEFRWGDETLRFDLQPDGEGCVLTFVNTFDELGKAARDAAGWHVCLDVLGYHLDGQQAPWSSGEQWRQVHSAYVERLGPEASTTGPPDAPDRTAG